MIHIQQERILFEKQYAFKAALIAITARLIKKGTKRVSTSEIAEIRA